MQIAESRGELDRCWAYFFIGMRHRAGGRPEEAKEFLRKCVETGLADCPELAVAKAELLELS